MEQEEIYFKCADCPDCWERDIDGMCCNYFIDNWFQLKGIEFKTDIPDWCPRFPL